MASLCQSKPLMRPSHRDTYPLIATRRQVLKHILQKFGYPALSGYHHRHPFVQLPDQYQISLIAGRRVHYTSLFWHFVGNRPIAAGPRRIVPKERATFLGVTVMPRCGDVNMNVKYF
jgi:hypothetical protein